MLHFFGQIFGYIIEYTDICPIIFIIMHTRAIKNDNNTKT